MSSFFWLQVSLSPDSAKYLSSLMLFLPTTGDWAAMFFTHNAPQFD